MGIFKKAKRGGFADVIRCDEENYLIWKWHPDKYEEGSLKRETAIRTTSVLRVKNGEVAVFVYKKGDGELEDYIVGPHDQTIKTKNFPVLSSIIGMWYEGDTPFQAEVFFINLAGVIQIRFGIPYFPVVDPRFVDFEVPVAVRGTINFKIEDYKRFVKLHRLVTFDLDSFQSQVQSTAVRMVKDLIVKSPRENNIPVIQLESKAGDLSELALATLKPKFDELYGVSISNVDITAIEIDKESESYQELKRITKDITSRQAEANIQDYEEKLRIQREEGQYAQHMQTRQQNIGAYQTEVKGEVGVASAEALGKMGENGAGDVDMGGDHHGGAGFNPMTIAAGLAVGTAVAKNLSGTIDGAMGAGGQTPPPLPSVTYHVALDGNASGPFEAGIVQQMISDGRIKKDTLVWKQGTPSWVQAGSLDEFKAFFPPELPK